MQPAHDSDSIPCVQLGSPIDALALLDCLGKLDERLASANAQGDRLLGDSHCIRDLRHQIERVAAADGPVLLEGETGTGKELVAERIHRIGRRSTGPLVMLNCAAITGSLVESELFGHLRGAYTGAATDRTGLFEAADRGILFLDEVLSLPLDLQPKLLRALEGGEVRQVGGNHAHRVDVRIIAACNEPMQSAVDSQQFRADLMYRINTFRIAIPPLRARLSDVPLLLRSWLSETDGPKGVSLDAMLALLSHPYPGNVRMLKHVVDHARAFADSGLIQLHDLPDEFVRLGRELLTGDGIRQRRASGAPTEIIEALAEHDWNITATAQSLGVCRTTLWRIMRRNQIERPSVNRGREGDIHRSGHQRQPKAVQ